MKENFVETLIYKLIFEILMDLFPWSTIDYFNENHMQVTYRKSSFQWAFMIDSSTRINSELYIC